MRVLFMAPLPPPINGHSLVLEALKDGLAARHDIDSVDLGRDSSSDGSVTRARLKATAVLLRDLCVSRAGSTRHISPSRNRWTATWAFRRKRPPVPAESDHPFRLKAATSAGSR